MQIADSPEHIANLAVGSFDVYDLLVPRTDHSELLQNLENPSRQAQDLIETCHMTRESSVGYKKAWAASLSQLEHYRAVCEITEQVWALKDAPDHVEGAETPVKEVGHIPSIEGHVLEQHGFVEHDGFYYNRSVQPMSLKPYNVYRQDDREMLNPVNQVVTEKFVMVFSCLQDILDAEKSTIVHGGGLIYGGMFLPIVVMPEHRIMLNLPSDCATFLFWLGPEDVKDEDVRDANEFLFYRSELPPVSEYVT